MLTTIIIIVYLVGVFVAFMFIGIYNYKTRIVKDKVYNINCILSWFSVIFIIISIIIQTDFFDAESVIRKIAEKIKESKKPEEPVKLLHKKDVENLLRKLYNRMSDRPLTYQGYLNFIDEFLYKKK